MGIWVRFSILSLLSLIIILGSSQQAMAGQSSCSEDSDCDDGNPCTSNQCGLGDCLSLVLDGQACDDGNACTANQCNESGQCETVGLLLCSDGDGCNGEETCLTCPGGCYLNEGELCCDGTKLVGDCCSIENCEGNMTCIKNICS